ncbi:MAG TPA: hypothetical protein VGS06_17790 [Streptosporangiaceae bacterium]|nr:hypothetical protein [Streptosporangiaceae bacterium]
MTATEERQLRRALHGTLQSVSPPPVPLEAIARQGKVIRRRRAGAAVGALALAGIVALTSLALRASQPPAVPPTAPAMTAGPDGVFAHGTADGHPWRLAVQNIADPGYRCLPAIVINGTDADPVYPAPGNAASVTLDQAVRGVAFAFIQLPAGVGGVIVNGDQNVPAVIVNACGYRYHLVGFSYSMAGPLRVTLAKPYPGWPDDVFVPTLTTPGGSTQDEGLWLNTYTYTAPGVTTSATLASGTLPGGPGWIIKLQFGPGGDCYEFAQNPLGGAQMGYCGPVSTPAGPETIMALPLGFGQPGVSGATGYAVPVSPATARVRAVLDNGSSVLATPRIVDGRKYVAFVVPSPRSLHRLIWLDAGGQVMASTTAVPQYGYTQFQP